MTTTPLDKLCKTYVSIAILLYREWFEIIVVQRWNDLPWVFSRLANQPANHPTDLRHQNIGMPAKNVFQFLVATYTQASHVDTANQMNT